MSTPFETVIDPAYIADLETADLAAIESKRAACETVENGLSYARRLVHGRLDIVRSELERRRAGAGPAALDDIIGRLPDLLADPPSSAVASAPRPPQDMVPGSYGESLGVELESIFPATAIAGLADADADRLAGLVDGLSAFEGRLSVQRRSLHGVIDTVQAEIIRRYQDGDASVDSLFQ